MGAWGIRDVHSTAADGPGCGVQQGSRVPNERCGVAVNARGWWSTRGGGGQLAIMEQGFCLKPQHHPQHHSQHHPQHQHTLIETCPSQEGRARSKRRCCTRRRRCGVGMTQPLEGKNRHSHGQWRCPKTCARGMYGSTLLWSTCIKALVHAWGMHVRIAPAQEKRNEERVLPWTT